MLPFAVFIPPELGPVPSADELSPCPPAVPVVAQEKKKAVQEYNDEFTGFHGYLVSPLKWLCGIRAVQQAAVPPDFSVYIFLFTKI
jgi:hypothetical protein